MRDKRSNWISNIWAARTRHGGMKKVHKACISIAIASAFYLHFRQIHTTRERKKSEKLCDYNVPAMEANYIRRIKIDIESHMTKKEGKNRGDYPRNANKWLVVSECYRNIPIHNAHITKPSQTFARRQLLKASAPGMYACLPSDLLGIWNVVVCARQWNNND